MLIKTLIVLLLISLTWTSLISELAKTIDTYFTIRYELKALAIDERGRGSIIPIEITMKRPGRGKLYHDEKTIGRDTLISIKLALLYASTLSGVDYRKYDYYIGVRSPYMVKGASATLLFTLAFTSILSNISIPIDTSATGIVGPGGAIGLVLGIGPKLAVAEENKLKGVIARATISTNKSIYVPAYTVIDAYAKYVGNTIVEPVFMNHNDFAPTLYTRLLGMINTYHYLSNKSSNVLNIVKDRWQDEYYTRALKYLNMAQRFYEKGYYYTASSLGFISLYNVYTSLLNYLYTHDKARYSEIRDEILNETMYMMNYVDSLIKDIVKKYRENDEIPIVIIDSLVTTKTRIMDSKIVLNDLLDPERSISSEQSLYSFLLSYLYARTITAVSWANMTIELSHYENYTWYVDIDNLSTLMPYLEDFVNTTIEYCRQLFTAKLATPIQSNVDHNIDPLMRYIDLVASFLVFTKSFYSFNIVRAAFTNGYETSDLVNLLPWIRGLLYSMSPEPGELLSSILLLELVDNYIGLDGIDTEDLISMVYQEFARLLMYMMLKMKIHGDIDKHQIVSFKSTHIVFLISATYYVAGAILVYISIKRQTKPNLTIS